MAMIEEGKKAPEFKLASSEGGEVSLKGLRGKTVVALLLPEGRHAGLHAARPAPSATARPPSRRRASWSSG